MSEERSGERISYRKKWLMKHRMVCTYLGEDDYKLFEDLKKRLGIYGAEILRKGIRLLAEDFRV